MESELGAVVELFPDGLELEDIFFAYSLRAGRRMAFRVKDVISTISPENEILFHVKTESMTFSVPRTYKFAVIRRGGGEG